MWNNIIFCYFWVDLRISEHARYTERLNTVNDACSTCPESIKALHTCLTNINEAYLFMQIPDEVCLSPSSTQFNVPQLRKPQMEKLSLHVGLLYIFIPVLIIFMASFGAAVFRKLFLVGKRI